MNSTAPSLEIAYGSVWLVSAGAGDPRHLSPLAAHALGTGDAVIHDLENPDEILERVKPPRYRDAAVPGRAIERSIKLAQRWPSRELVRRFTCRARSSPGPG
jgi:siroheme synthase